MSGHLPDRVNPWRMVAERRLFEAEVALGRFDRLRDGLASTAGTVRVALSFDTDELGQAFVQLRVLGALPLLCQRSLEPFALPVDIDVRLGLIRDPDDEASLPPGYEALLVEAAEIVPMDLVEDELILALPVVALSPRESPESTVWKDPGFDEEPRSENPFAALRGLQSRPGPDNN